MTATRGALLTEARAALRRAGVDNPDLDARLLASAAFGCDAAQLVSRADETVTADEQDRLARHVARRIAGEPVARILGRREFWGLSFDLAPDTLVPRPDTETLVEAALDHVRAAGLTAPRVLDLGTGSGCLLIALLHEIPNATGIGVDISPDAVRAARGNAFRLGVGARAGFVAGRWTEAVTGQFDLILSNPPYIPSADIAGLEREVRDFDPARALDGGADGLDAYRALAALLPEHLAPGGAAVLELGIGQHEPVAALMPARGLQVAGSRTDLGGVVRALIVKCAFCAGDDENPLGNGKSTR